MSEKNKVQNLTTEKTDFKREIGVFGGVSIIVGITITLVNEAPKYMSESCHAVLMMLQ